MEKNEKKEIITVAGTIALIIMLSTSIWILPVIGNLINPNGNFWNQINAPDDHPEYQEVVVPGLSGENVTVLRDRFGVPHIYASDYKDLFFAYGYVQSQDRFFEMTLLKLVGWGRLSEVIGSLGVDIDKYLRTIGLGKSAHELIKVAEENKHIYPRTYKMLQYFTKGINTWLDNNRHNLPIEFNLLDLPVEYWSLNDSAVMANLAGLMLSWTMDDLSMEELRLIMGPYLKENENIYGVNAFDELYPDWDMSYPYEFPILPDSHSIYASSKNNNPYTGIYTSDLLLTIHSLLNINKRFQDFLGMVENDCVGSNNWVIDGTISTTGKPILCGDPHLMYMTPAIWYEAHLVCNITGYDEYSDPKTKESYRFQRKINSYGVSFPGTPTILIGHNEHCAWSETNVGSDSFADFYKETLNADKTQYLFNDKWYDVDVIDSPIKVKLGDFYYYEPFEIHYTRHGPILSNLLGLTEISTTISELGMPSFIPEDITVKYIGNNVNANYNQLVAFDLLNRAQNVTGIKMALDAYPNPPQNFVCADDLGNIGMICAGLYPMRAKNGIYSPEYSGRYIQPGNGTGEEWIGFVPPEHIPHCINPVGQAYLASANQRTIASSIYGYSIGHEWAPGWRGRSINRYLDTTDPSSPFFNKKISFEDMQNIQYSSYDVAAEVYIPEIINTYDGLSNPAKLKKSDEFKQVIEIFREWSNSDTYQYLMHQDLIAPTIFDKWMSLLPGKVWGDEWADAGMSGNYPHAQILQQYITEKPNDNPWFDNIATTSEETKQDIILDTLNDAITVLSQKYGSLIDNSEEWIWGNHHKLATIGIPLIFNILLNREVDTLPIPGSSRCLNNAFGIELEMDLGPLHISMDGLVLGGPSWRQVIDFSQIENSVGIYPGGQRENIASKHYMDQAPLWAAGNYKRMLYYPTAEEFVQGEIESTFILRRS